MVGAGVVPGVEDPSLFAGTGGVPDAGDRPFVAGVAVFGDTGVAEEDDGAGAVDLTAFYLFAIVFFWTPPHFWALALRLNSDYGRAQVPMLQVVRGRQETERQILLYSVVLLAITLLLGLRGFGTFYMVAALLLGAGFVAMAVMTMRDPGTRWARRTYKYSLLYLALVFAAMVGDALLRGSAGFR